MLSYFKMVSRHSKPFSTCGITGKWRFSHISLPKNDGNIHLGNHFLKVITKKIGVIGRCGKLANRHTRVSFRKTLQRYGKKTE